jgi:hypothetical protein
MGNGFIRGILASALLAALLSAAPVSAQTGMACRFVLGFATLRDLIPNIVGECQGDQFFAANGDAQQHTTGGLLVWRKADNWTAFTDGTTTWLNGPEGLESRPNTERFAWEQDLAVATTVRTADTTPNTSTNATGAAGGIAGERMTTAVACDSRVSSATRGRLGRATSTQSSSAGGHRRSLAGPLADVLAERECGALRGERPAMRGVESSPPEGIATGLVPGEVAGK